ncbi:Hypothetical predicted protein [Mytilus galloprovincialis]|uniref:Malate dehydrogenase n=1 Tax=Mytilus galloprovincialis TaxID=29158 RepID=A0A8B6CGA4_MYTGA|nr:Hypothetical predicted protein [Mytilus galloprovincialis]
MVSTRGTRVSTGMVPTRGTRVSTGMVPTRGTRVSTGMVPTRGTRVSTGMVPTRGTRDKRDKGNTGNGSHYRNGEDKPTLGTNPISIAAPGNHGDSFILDMATTVVAAGKLKIMASKHSILPANMIVDVNGHESRKYEDFNGVFPVGGREETGGYKGFGLAMMIDTLSGVLSGAEFGANCKGAGNLGLGFIAIDPNQFEDGFTNRMQCLIDACRNQPSADKDRPVLVPGDPEKQHMELCDKLGGIPYARNHLQFVERIAKRYKITPLL